MTTAMKARCVGVRQARPASLKVGSSPAATCGKEEGEMEFDPEIAKACGEPFAKRLALACRKEQEARDLLLELVAEKYASIRSPRSRLKHAASAWLHHRWGSLR